MKARAHKPRPQTEPGPPARRKGRPALQRDRTAKTVVVLLAKQLTFLSQVCSAIREREGKAVMRSDVVRGILAGVQASGIDLAEASSEDEIAALIGRRLSGGSIKARPSNA